MKEQNPVHPFDQAVSQLADPIRQILLYIPAAAKARTHEVRLRAGRPLCLNLGGHTCFVSRYASLSPTPAPESFPVTEDHIRKCIRSLCQYSYHTHARELRQGYIALPGGHRAGVCGTAVGEGEAMERVREFSSINLRIARDVPGCSSPILKALAGEWGGVLIAGAPGSGKTTLLRDLARQLASQEQGYRRVAVVDERGELSLDGAGNSLGISTDLLTGYAKSVGMMTALRTLSPEILICDEIGGGEEAEAVRACVNSGVRVVTSIHAGSLRELAQRPQAEVLLRTGAFTHLVQLEGPEQPCRVRKISKLGEMPHETDRSTADGGLLCPVGTAGRRQAC